MPLPRASGMRYAVLGLGLGVLLVAGCAPPQVAPQTTVFPKSPEAEQIQFLYALIFWLATLVFFAVQGAMVYTLWRYRYRQGHELPAQVHGNTRLEIGWTIAPAVVLFAIAIPTIQTIFALEGPSIGDPGSPNVANAMPIEVIGHQWWWEIRYPQQGVLTANEVVVPVGRPITLLLKSDDVVHSFWIPQLMGKQDVLPAHTNVLGFTAQEPGQYFGQCAEYCGIQHAHMKMNVIAYTPEDFDAWVARLQAPAQPTTELAQEGAEAFGRLACVGCHAIAGTTAQGLTGPNLSHFGSRTTLGAGILPNTTEHLSEWLRETQTVKPGVKMPNQNLRPRDVEALTEYLHSLK